MRSLEVTGLPVLYRACMLQVIFNQPVLFLNGTAGNKYYYYYYSRIFVTVWQELNTYTGTEVAQTFWACLVQSRVHFGYLGYPISYRKIVGLMIRGDSKLFLFWFVNYLHRYCYNWGKVFASSIVRWLNKKEYIYSRKKRKNIILYKILSVNSIVLQWIFDSYRTPLTATGVLH